MRKQIMFKKTLAAVAVLGAFAGSAFAANVTMYGIIDTGLGYTSTDKGYGEDVNKFDMRSGQNSASRFGVKGEEDLGNGLKVGFSLENGFNSDDGQLATEGRLFDREALLYVGGDFGELGMGRQGELASGNGRYGLFGGKVSPFSTGWSDIAGHKYVMGAGFGRMDNTITYKTPTFAGFNLLAQYSFDKNVKKDDDKVDTGVQHGREGSAETDRQYALGVTFAAGDLYLAGIVTQTNKQSVKFDGQSLGKQDDPLTVSLGGNYNFGVAKLYVAGQYFKDSDLAVQQIDRYNEDTNTNGQTGQQFNGFGLTVGADVPAFGGTAKALVGYMDADDQAATDAHDMQRYAFSVGYEYPLSKRTFVYGGAGYYVDSYDKVAAGRDDKASVAAVNAGLVHKF
jgi:putative outer membrane porin protein